MKSSDGQLQLPSNMKFGSFFTVVFLIVALYFLWSGSVVTGILFAIVAGIFAVVTFLKSELLLPLNKLWMRFGLLLGMIVSPIVLGLM